MTRINFAEVARYAERTFKCQRCGKRRVRRRKFWQTLNPFNKNKDGTVKSREDIYRELDAEAAAWKPECGCPPGDGVDKASGGGAASSQSGRRGEG